MELMDKLDRKIIRTECSSIKWVSDFDYTRYR